MDSARNGQPERGACVKNGTVRLNESEEIKRTNAWLDVPAGLNFTLRESHFKQYIFVS